MSSEPLLVTGAGGRRSGAYGGRSDGREVGIDVAAPGGTVTGRSRLTAGEGFWYFLMCLAFGAGYLRKVPTKKALSEAGMAKTTGGETIWYVVLCLCFGVGYFAKVPVKKAPSDAGRWRMTGGESTWYLILCLLFGAGYFVKVPVKKALSELTVISGATSF